MKIIHINHESELNHLVDEVLAITEEVKLIMLYGDLGAGKTTFTKRFVASLGSVEEASSPTYSIINEYDTNSGKLYHIDLYRLQREEEALDIAIEDYLFSGSYCLVEWPQVIEGLVTDAIVLRFEAQEDGSRMVEIDIHKS